MQVSSKILNALQSYSKGRFDGLPNCFKFLTLIGKSLQFSVAVVQFFQKSFDGFLAHAKTHPFPEFELVVLLRIRGYDRFEVVPGELEVD